MDLRQPVCLSAAALSAQLSVTRPWACLGSREAIIAFDTRKVHLQAQHFLQLVICTGK